MMSPSVIDIGLRAVDGGLVGEEVVPLTLTPHCLTQERLTPSTVFPAAVGVAGGGGRPAGAGV